MTETSARWKAWRHAFLTTNPPPGGVGDGVTRWLVVTRAGVLPMTLTSGLMAVLLAAIAPVQVDWLNVALAVVGLVVAHLANNLMNDLADTRAGTDTEKYPRALYAPHPILSGLVTKRQLVVGILLCQIVDLAIMLTLVARRDWWIAAFALGGLFLSWAYTAPPLRLKRIGLGELDVLITWGPLMVGGTYYAGTGTLPGRCSRRRPSTPCCPRACSWANTSTSCPTTVRRGRPRSRSSSVNGRPGWSPRP